MKVKQETLNDVTICIPEGEINITTSPELRKIFEGFIRANEKKVLINFSGISYIDSSGLATLIEMLQRLKGIGGKMRFSNMEQKIKNIFEITKLYKLFEIFDNQETALKDF